MNLLNRKLKKKELQVIIKHNNILNVILKKC